MTNTDARAAEVAGPDALAAALRNWTRGHDPHVSAAVELLIGHGTWLRRRDFIRAAVRKNGPEAWIAWMDARAFVDAGTRASTSEHAILDMAVALGEDHFRFSIMGHANSRLIAQAVARAVGEDQR
jgi:hypothetical protein